MADYITPWTTRRAVFSESLSIACQYGQCEKCPDATHTFEDDDLACTCVCHIPDACDAVG